ncbi:MAG TPA: iron-containing alcohol dehydrogenase [Syntrophales bacterium]|nr:iron-containing alcohol dehydrogenase [Syntrophales bacterium]
MNLSSPIGFLCPTKIVSGDRALENIPNELAGLDARKPLFLLSGEAAAQGLFRVVEKALADGEMRYGVLSGVPEEADLTHVREAALAYRDHGHDALVAVGGGAVADVAKTVNIAVSGRPEDLGRFHETGAGPLKPLVIVPTLGGSGYETTRWARLGGRRWRSWGLMPKMVVVDPRMLAGDDKRGISAAGIALVQAAEALLSAPANPFLRAYAGAALAILSRHLGAFVRGEGRAKRLHALGLANASQAASIAFANAPPGVVHCLGRVLARRWKQDPGMVMAFLLGASIEEKARREPEAFTAVTPLSLGFGTLPTPGAEGFGALVGTVKALAGEVLSSLGWKGPGIVPSFDDRRALAREAREEAEGGFDEEECLRLLDVVFPAGEV